MTDRTQTTQTTQTTQDAETSPHNARAPWLDAVYEQRRERTARLTRAAVDDLTRRRQAVTIPAICALSVSLDPGGRGIGPAAVRGNEEAYAYYRQHSASHAAYHHHRRSRSPSGTAPAAMAAAPATVQPQRLSPTRDLDRARRRYLHEDKRRLVERLLTVEQAHAEAQEHLTRVQFELVTVQRELRAAQQPSRS